ncbi:hypothetical protein GH714_016991 [Hevea brasiliensis]|uniref:Mechanosensitive ion channel protein 2/3 C-terminal domain-containing protein n=1 Tax=Hevea brasiliensis TaxID=3981 RepID=A0A6A6K5D5_HEVBR|nr:hypothetical protein GH714_016991 [Hevea brasiliensis]
MSKVLAKNPQVEQWRLHRRVFLDNINPENQALLVSASSYNGIVPYLISYSICVPLQIVRDSIYKRGGMASNHPLLLIEPSYRINVEDKAKSQAHSGRGVGDQENKAASRSTSDIKTGGSPSQTPRPKKHLNLKLRCMPELVTPNSNAKDHTHAATASTSDIRVVYRMPVKSSPNSVPKMPNFAEASNSESKAAGSVSNNVYKTKRCLTASSLRLQEPV